MACWFRMPPTRSLLLTVAAIAGGSGFAAGHAGAKLALGDQLALRIDANLAGNEQQVSGAHEADIIRHRAWGLMQDNALRRQLLLDRTRHVSSPFDSTSTRTKTDRGRFVSRIVLPLASEGNAVAEMPKNMAVRPQIILFRDVAAVAAQWGGQ